MTEPGTPNMEHRLLITDYRLRLIVITWLTAVLRFHALFANSFHADEALFASWARLIAVWRDPLLQTVPVDKPPLLFYVQALFFPLQGPVEWAARLPNLVASIVLVPLVGVWVWRWYRDEKTAVFAAALVALSPLHIQFSATAFTDPLLTTLLVGALAAGGKSTNNKQQIAGLLFGLAAATKHQAWLFLPLVVGTAVLSRRQWREWRRWLVGFLPVWGLVVGWAVVRTGSFSLWTQQMSNFGGLRLIWSWELWPRLHSWWALMQTMWGWGITAVFLFIIFTWLTVSNINHNWTQISQINADKRKKICVHLRSSVSNSSSFDWLLVCFVLGYFLLHWFVAVPVWDRYLLLLVPLLAVLVARSLVEIGKLVYWWIGRRIVFLLIVTLLTVFLLIGGWQGRNGRFSVGGQVDADQGAAVVAEWLANAPYGTVLYDHWYSWYWSFHLFDKRVFVHWFPHPDALAEDLAAFGHDGSPRYLVLPNADVALPVHRAVESGGFRLEPVPLSTESGMILYWVLPDS